ncbi:hypothetical protein OG21DRAFT_739541 [Imleria badia]|nr:hypothetical protein OG21DRAFT_739541 [Imleria badia]
MEVTRFKIQGTPKNESKVQIGEVTNCLRRDQQEVHFLMVGMEMTRTGEKDMATRARWVARCRGDKRAFLKDGSCYSSMVQYYSRSRGLLLRSLWDECRSSIQLRARQRAIFDAHLGYFENDICEFDSGHASFAAELLCTYVDRPHRRARTLAVPRRSRMSRIQISPGSPWYESGGETGNQVTTYS